MNETRRKKKYTRLEKKKIRKEKKKKMKKEKVQERTILMALRLSAQCSGSSTIHALP